MANFYIADPHLEHANVIKFDPRPFKDTKDMLQQFRQNWNTAVTDNDTVFICGDFIWGKDAIWQNIVPQFNGRKVLIRGNHDPKEYSREVRKLFVDIRETMELTDSGKHVILSHYPMPFHKGDYNTDCYMLYGHVHHSREAQYMREIRDMVRKRINGTRGEPRGQFIHIGCMEPYMNYTPRTLEEIIQGDAQYDPAP